MLKSRQSIWSRCAIALSVIGLGWLLYAMPVQAQVIAPQSDAAYREGVQSMYEQVKADPNTPTNRAFKDVLDQLFKPAAVQIPFRFVTETDKIRSVNYAGNIYGSNGAIFINYEGDVPDEERFATIEDKLYTWKPNAPEGQILKRFPGDTLAFVMYMVDPSAIMRSIYSAYLTKPQDFTTVTAPDGSQSLLFKQVQSGFKGIRIQPQPFWLKAFLLEASKDQGMSVGSLEVDAPIALTQLPKELTILPTGIKFKPSDNSLKERMTYL
jgi:hypothetical protein